MPYIYLVSPYTDERHWIERDRAEYAARAAALLMHTTGATVFCPVAHGRFLLGSAKELQSWDHSTWMKHCKRMLQHAHMLALLPLNGWSLSKGVNEEIRIATSLGIPCFVLQSKGVLSHLPLHTVSPATLKKRNLQLWL